MGGVCSTFVIKSGSGKGFVEREADHSRTKLIVSPLPYCQCIHLSLNVTCQFYMLKQGTYYLSEFKFTGVFYGPLLTFWV